MNTYNLHFSEKTSSDVPVTVSGVAIFWIRDQKYAIRKREAHAYVRTKLANAHSIFTPEAVIQYCTRASGRRQKTA